MRTRTNLTRPTSVNPSSARTHRLFPAPWLILMAFCLAYEGPAVQTMAQQKPTAAAANVQKDEDIKQLRQKADQGNADAQYEIGLRYESGSGVIKDLAEAAKWFPSAAEQGVSKAQYDLGLSYSTGRGVTQDYAEAVKWFRRSAEQGVAVAQFNLGTLYDGGRGVDQDFAEAATWFRKAAEQGFGPAQFNLGVSYYNGQGVLKDYVEALKWISLAAQTRGANQGQFLTGRDKVAAAMTSEQVAEAQKRADNWLKAFATPTGPTGQPSAPVLRIIKWSSLMGCEYLRGRRLDNKLKVSPDSTLPLNEGEEMKLANGEVHGGPYDAMGIGTYVEVSANDWVTVCGVTFRNGSFTVTDRGFEFSAATNFSRIP